MYPRFRGRTGELALRWRAGRWHFFAPPVFEEAAGWYSGVVALSTRSAWAVGGWENFGDGIFASVDRWTGREWVGFDSGFAVDGEDWLEGVAAVSQREIWAVGGVYANREETVVVRWDGARWSRVQSPSPGSAGSSLDAVAHVPGTRRVWAVGRYVNLVRNVEGEYVYGPTRTLIERYC
jgi:hypothetical protein